MNPRIRVLIAVLLLGACDAPKTSEGPAAGADAAPSKASGAPPAVADGGADAQSDNAGAALPKAEDLLEKAVAAQGGREKIDALDSFYLEGELLVSAQKIKGAMKLWWQAGDFYIEQTMVGIGTVRAGKQGDVIWSEDPINGLRRLTGGEAEQQAWASTLSLPAHWKRYFESAATTGQREIGGKKVYDVMLTSKSGATVTLSLDAESGLQVAQSFKQTTPMGQMPMSTEFKDYRDVEGLKLPYLQVTDAMLATATQTLTKIELGAKVDPTKFAMPTKGATVVRPASK